jgi:predicted nucleic acid-binding protein
MIGATFDTGALIALERRELGMVMKLRVLHQAGVPITIPANAVTEFWRKGHGQAAILALGTIEPVTESVAKAAGEALAKVRAATVVDATVMASAAARGDRVFTSDPKDMRRLQAHFRAVVDIIAV